MRTTLAKATNNMNPEPFFQVAGVQVHGQAASYLTTDEYRDGEKQGSRPLEASGADVTEQAGCCRQTDHEST